MVLVNYNKKTKVECDVLDFEKIKDSIFSILKSNKLLTIATLDKENNSPYVSSAYYVFDDDFNLYIWTDPDSKHGKNISFNNEVAVNIADTNQPWGSALQGLQIKGKCSKLSFVSIIKPAKLYIERYPLVKKFIKIPTDFNNKYESRLYKIEIYWIKLFDEKKFGKEVWKEFKILHDNSK